MDDKPSGKTARVAIVGGGAGGSTVALKLAELGLDVTLYEQGSSLVNGPPVCHLHAGGSLYRELSDQNCLELLEQSIETVRSYPSAVKVRPTVITVPKRDTGSVASLLPRLELLKERYQALVSQDYRNAVLGEPNDFYQLFDEARMNELATRPIPEVPETADDWMTPLAHELDLTQLKYPLVLVQEYGVSLFRLAASVDLALTHLPNLDVRLNTQVTQLQARHENKGWSVEFVESNDQSNCEHFDYLVNACGFRTGVLDDCAGYTRQRMVEFKAAYLAKWQSSASYWPEVVFHGQRGTPHGMAQLTPYADGLFQLHGMTEEITLFKGGLVQNQGESAQPQLPETLLSKIGQGWPEAIITQRTRRAIAHVAEFIPDFYRAETAGKPLFGAQQIPGDNPDLRTACASFSEQRYARIEIVKLSSALHAANLVLLDLAKHQLWQGEQTLRESRLTTPPRLYREAVIERAKTIAQTRGYPVELAL